VVAEERFQLGDHLLLAVPKFLRAPGAQRCGWKSKRRCANKTVARGRIPAAKESKSRSHRACRRDHSNIDPDRYQVLLREPLALHAQDVRSFVIGASDAE
jgi:hypothetical protein